MSEETYNVQFFGGVTTPLYLLITFWKSLSKNQVLVLHPMCIGVLYFPQYRGGS